MITEHLEKYLLKLRKKTLANLMVAAVSEMEAYNGQSVTSAICKAMGAELKETEHSIEWKLPPSKEVEDNLG